MRGGVILRFTGVVAATGLLLALTGIGGPVAAAGNSASFRFLFGTDFLCRFGPCPAIALADNGDMVLFGGSGTFDLSTKAATGSGTFTHENPMGVVLGSGTWRATGLLSFQSFGPSPGSFPLVGGHALIQVELRTAAGATLTGIITIFCIFGEVPGDKMEDVNLLNIQDVINFNKVLPGVGAASGGNVFIQL